MSMPSPPSPPTASREATLAKAKPPGIALVVAGALTIVGGLGNCLLGILPAADPSTPDEAKGMAFIVWGFLACVAIALGIVTIIGGMKMQSLQSYGFALTASILCMLPCHSCCIVGLPIGIWSLVVLMQPDVKAAFR